MPRPLRLQHVVSSIRWASTAPKKPPPLRAYKPPPKTVEPEETESQEHLQLKEQPQSQSKPVPPEPEQRGATEPKPKPQRGRWNPNEPQPEPPEKQPLSTYTQSPSRILGLVLASGVAGLISFYIVSLIQSSRQPTGNPRIAELSQQKDVSARYEDTADTFDSEVGFSEWLMGINTKRARLAGMCTGHVLEASCGTGRNLGYFFLGRGSSVESLTFVDLSPKMVEVCRRKWEALYSGSKKEQLRGGLQVRFLTGSVLANMPTPPGKTNGKYDTILQTMGLCSTSAPVELLVNLAQYLDTSNPDARILLLEHGRSYRKWLNTILDNSAEKHAEIHGCWFNREIASIVEEAAQKAGLEVVREKRWHFGTTSIFELKPTKTSTEKAVEQKKDVGEEAPKKGGWFGFWK